MNQKALIIVPYFGKFPNYFPLFCQSAYNNRNLLDFLVVTDNNLNLEKYSNIKVVKTTFNKFKNRIQSKFEFKIALNQPYKLNDFKPAYGYILDEYISSEYTYWGFCDLDVIFGDMESYLSKVMGKYDKISNLGHFQLYRNTDEIKKLFMNIGNRKFQNYKKVFSNSANFSFDEQFGIGVISIDNDVLTAYPQHKKLIADITPSIKNFTVAYDYPNENNYFYYDKGKIYRVFEDRKREYIYIHLQKRNMEYNNEVGEKFYIVPNKFIFKDIDALSMYNSVGEDYIEYRQRKNKERCKKILNFSSLIHSIEFKLEVKRYFRKYEK